AEREGQVPRRRVGARVYSGTIPVTVGPQRLVAVTGVHVDQIVGFGYDFLGYGVRNPLGDRAVLLPRVDPVEILAIDRAVVDRAGQERRHVGHVHDDQGSLE